jgi:acetyltransferase-like isoleucine patch superfamily enzyme
MSTITGKPRIPLRHILTVGLLPSPLKKLVYRLAGYRIGRGVSLGWGSVICGKCVTIGDHTGIGFFTILRGSRITLGRHVSIGALTFLDTPTIEIGEDSRINEQVFIGGLQAPDSRFVLGKRCQIFQLSYINPAQSITVGDDSAIGGHSLLFGHASWMSELDGYPVTFAPIEIGSRVSISWRVFVLPGVKIGDGTVVGAHSLVNKSLPSECLATGSPARIVARAPFFPRTPSAAEKEALLKRVVDGFIEYLREAGFRCRQEPAFLEVSRDGSAWGLRRPRSWRLGVRYAAVSPPPFATAAPRLDVCLSLTRLSSEQRRELDAAGTVWIDVERRERADRGDPFAEEVIQFLRRHGLRFTRTASQEGTHVSSQTA